MTRISIQKRTQLLALIFLSTVSYLFWEFCAEKDVSTNIAYIQGEQQTLSSAVTARVSKVHIHPGDKASSNQVLIELEKRDWQEQYDEATQSFQATEVSLAHLKTQLPYWDRILSVQKNAIQDLTGGVEAARSTQNRHVKLGDFVAEKDKESAALVISEQLSAFYQSEDAYQATLLKKQQHMAEIEAQEQQLAALQQRLDYLEAQRKDYEITLPYASQIHTVHTGEGTIVSTGEPVVTLTPKQQFWLTAYFKETELNNLSVGTHAEIVLDAYPDKVFTGEIVSVSELAGSALSPSTPNYSAGNFTRIVQRIPVKIKFTTYPEIHLAIGLSASVSVTSI